MSNQSSREGKATTADADYVQQLRYKKIAVSQLKSLTLAVLPVTHTHTHICNIRVCILGSWRHLVVGKGYTRTSNRDLQHLA